MTTTICSYPPCRHEGPALFSTQVPPLPSGTRPRSVVALACALMLLPGLVLAQPAGPGRYREAPEAPGTPQGSDMYQAGAAVLPGLPAAMPGSLPGIRGEAARKPRQAAPAPAPPVLAELEPTDFQRFVAAATGRMLPIFGAELFEAPASFAPVQDVPVSVDYTLGPGDEVLIRAWGSIDIDYRATIDRNGLISIPRVGVVALNGKKAGELEGVIRSHVGRVYTNFGLNATLGQLRAMQVFVVGQARRPGAYTISSLSTLVNALFASGGPNGNGSMRSVQLKRDGRVVSTLDLYEFLQRGERTGDVRLLPGDTIVIPPAGPRVALLGAVSQPAVYELLPGDASIGPLMSAMGGLPVLARRNQALLERVETHREGAPRTVENVTLDEAGMSRALRDGDVLTVLPIDPGFANAVTLRGAVATPLRHPFRPGMRVRDLIPERQALISPDYYRRKNMLVQFENEPGHAGVRDPLRRDSGHRVSVERLNEDVRGLFDEINFDYAVIERLDEQSLTTQLIPFNLGRAVLDGDPVANLELRAGDVVTVFSRKDLSVPQARQTRIVRVEGEVAAPGLYRLEAGETLRGLLSRIGGITSQAYVFGTELSRESARRRQQENLDQITRRLEQQLSAEATRRVANLNTNADATSVAAAAALQQQQQQLVQAQLGRMRSLRPNGRIALELPAKTDASLADLPDLPLEDADHIVIPSQPGFVAVVGAVANENTIIWKPGRTSGEILANAVAYEWADTSNAFVLRADGSVVGRGGAMTWSRNVDVRLMPGDTLVVPEKIDRETVWTTVVRGLKDWSQIFYQLGLGAAAVKTLQ